MKDLIKNLLPGLKEKVILAEYTTFKIGGPAKYFFVAESEINLIKIIKFARQEKIPFFVFGEGSNLLISDKGFCGLAIKIKNSEIKIKKTKIYAQAGANLGNVLRVCAKNGLTGLEWAAGIPGTVGGAIYGNAGAFGSSIRDSISAVRVLNFGKGGIVQKFSNKKCKFGYRDSIFKNNKNLFILSAEFAFKKGKCEEIKKTIKDNIKKRSKKQPKEFSAGSIFKNQKSVKKNKELIKNNPELEKFLIKNSIPAAVLIERSGLSGKKMGRARVSTVHANFIINSGGAKAKDVKKLIDLIKKKVKNKFNVDLEEEIRIID